jgi:hypothetical protein
MNGPTFGDSPATVINGALITPVLLLSTKLPPSVHAGEQAAIPNAGVAIAKVEIEIGKEHCDRYSQ